MTPHEIYLDKSEAKKCLFCGAEFYRDKRCTWKHWDKAKFCSRTCAGQYGGAISTSKMPSKPDYFWAKVEKRGELECWDWTGSKDRHGYGMFPYKGKMQRASRYALELSGVVIPHGHYACHTCDNPSCVNPSHIYAGTPKDNSADKINRKRQPLGSMCTSAKLTEQQVLSIRSDGRRKEILAMEYGVSPGNIKLILSRKTWRHI